ncbi:MAG: hypothetical protein U0136_06170 [Bdellovibrionota bacterium]
MIAKLFGVDCSPRCETVLALAKVLGARTVVPLAYRLANDREQSAIRLARGLDELPNEEARVLSLATLHRAGVGTIRRDVRDEIRKLIRITED